MHAGYAASSAPTSVDLDAACREAGLDGPILAEIEIVPNVRAVFGRARRAVSTRRARPGDGGVGPNRVVDVRGSDTRRLDEVHRDLHVVADL